MKQLDVLVHSPLSLAEAILDGMADAGKAFQIRRVKTEEFRVVRSFYDKSVIEVKH